VAQDQESRQLGDAAREGRPVLMLQDHWLPAFNYNVEEWFEGDRYKTLAICRNLAPEPE